MKAFEIDLSTKPTVLFHDPEKAQQYFIDDNSKTAWRNYFSKYAGLAELSEDISRGVYHGQTWTGRMFVEGYGEFKHDRDNDVWVVEDDEFGKITVDMPELDHEWNTIEVTKEIEKRFAHLRK